MRSWSVLFAMGLNFTPASSSFMTWKHAYSFQQFKGTVSRVCRPFFAQKTLSLRSYFSQDTIPLKRRIHQCSNIILCGDSLYCTDILQLCNWKIHWKQTCMKKCLKQKRLQRQFVIEFLVIYCFCINSYASFF